MYSIGQTRKGPQQRANGGPQRGTSFSAFQQNQRKECKSPSATKAALNRVHPKWHRRPGHPRALISLLPPWQTSWVTKHRRKRSRRKRRWRRKSGAGLRKSWRRLYLPRRCASRETWRGRRRLTRTTSSSGTRSRNFSNSPASPSKLTVHTWTWSPRSKTRYFTNRLWKREFHSSNSQPGSSQLSTRKWWNNYYTKARTNLREDFQAQKRTQHWENKPSLKNKKRPRPEDNRKSQTRRSVIWKVN